MLANFFTLQHLTVVSVSKSLADQKMKVYGSGCMGTGK